MTSPLLVFDLETIPDVAALRQHHALPNDIDDNEVVAFSQRLWRQSKGHDFLPLYWHRVVSISCLLKQNSIIEKSAPALEIFSLPKADDITNEASAIQSFFELINRFKPQLISWNGGGFDLPVLHYRAMKHQLVAKTYWRQDGDFRWNNYTNRYHNRHLDLMDVLSLYQNRAVASLDAMAKLCGLPGKVGGHGSSVWDMWQNKAIDDIRHYGENDVILTYLLYLRFQQFCHGQSETTERHALHHYLKQNKRWQALLAEWTTP